jgi:hypothetical protein
VVSGDLRQSVDLFRLSIHSGDVLKAGREAECAIRQALLHQRLHLLQMFLTWLHVVVSQDFPTDDCVSDYRPVVHLQVDLPDISKMFSDIQVRFPVHPSDLGRHSLAQ